MFFLPVIFLFVFNHLGWLDWESDPSMGIRFYNNFLKIFLKVFIHVCDYDHVHDHGHSIPYRAWPLKDHKILPNSYKLESYVEGPW